MAEALPLVLCLAAVIAVLVMSLHGCRRRPAGEGRSVRRAISKASSTRQAVRKATRGKLAELSAALDSDKPETEIAELANQAQEGRE